MILLLKMCFIFGQENPYQKVNVIDPGHGGKDSGAIGINGIQEKNVVLNIAKEILKLNRNIEDPFDIYLTRYSDTLISLSDRTKLAKALNADLFVSLHCNYSDNPDARGVEIYASRKQGKFTKTSVFIGYQIERALCEAIGYESRGVKFGNFQVLRETTDYCPAVFIELGFLSNLDESDYLANSNQNKRLAFLIINSFKERR